MITTVNCTGDSIAVNDKVVVKGQEVANLDSTGFKKDNKFFYNTKGSILENDINVSMVCE